MTTDAAEVEAAIGRTGPGVTYHGVIILEWPAPQHREHGAGVLAAWKLKVRDASSGSPILSVMRADIHAPANDVVTADLTMLADEDGAPVFDGKPRIREGSEGPEVICGTFPFLVAEMRVCQ